MTPQFSIDCLATPAFAWPRDRQFGWQFDWREEEHPRADSGRFTTGGTVRTAHKEASLGDPIRPKRNRLAFLHHPAAKVVGGVLEHVPIVGDAISLTRQTAELVHLIRSGSDWRRRMGKVLESVKESARKGGISEKEATALEDIRRAALHGRIDRSQAEKLANTIHKTVVENRPPPRLRKAAKITLHVALSLVEHVPGVLPVSQVSKLAWQYLAGRRKQRGEGQPHDRKAWRKKAKQVVDTMRHEAAEHGVPKSQLAAIASLSQAINHHELSDKQLAGILQQVARATHRKPGGKKSKASRKRKRRQPQQQFEDAGRGSENPKGQWITIGADRDAPPGERGGTPIRVHRGRITAGPSGLQGKKLSELRQADPTTKPQHALRHASRQHRVNERDLSSALEQVWSEKQEAIRTREKAKARARQLTGITQADHGRLANAGRDHTVIRGFDTAARQIAGEFPELGIGRGYEDESGFDDTDYAAALWDLIGEGKQNPPARHDPDLLDEAAQLVLDTRRSDRQARREENLRGLGAIPFSQPYAIETCDWIDQFDDSALGHGLSMRRPRSPFSRRRRTAWRRRRSPGNNSRPVNHDLLFLRDLDEQRARQA